MSHLRTLCLPPAIFMVVMEWVEHSLNDYKSLVLPLNYITILVSDTGLEPVLYPWKGYVFMPVWPIAHCTYIIPQFNAFVKHFFKIFGILERTRTFKQLFLRQPCLPNCTTRTFMELTIGVEPTTYWLQVSCSTD